MQRTLITVILIFLVACSIESPKKDLPESDKGNYELDDAYFSCFNLCESDNLCIDKCNGEFQIVLKLMTHS